MWMNRSDHSTIFEKPFLRFFLNGYVCFYVLYSSNSVLNAMETQFQMDFIINLGKVFISQFSPPSFLLPYDQDTYSVVVKLICGDESIICKL